MATARAHVKAPPEVVFDVLRDPASYPLWVVGSKHIRGVDADWPTPGSKLYHTLGWGPITRHDNTEVLDIDPSHRIRLEARAWPFGTAEVEITLSPARGGTDLEMTETPRSGPAGRFNNPLMELGIQARNVWSLHRLCRWAQERHRGTPGHEPDGTR